MHAKVAGFRLTFPFIPAKKKGKREITSSPSMLYAACVLCTHTHSTASSRQGQHSIYTCSLHNALYIFFLKGPAIAGFRFSLVGRNIYIVILRSRRNQKGIIEKKIRTVKKKLS
jgi:hypothetical protein